MVDESNPVNQDDSHLPSWMIYLEIIVMNEVVKYNAGVDVSDWESSILDETLESLYGTHPSFSLVVDSLNAQFGSIFSNRMLRFHSRSGTMCRPLYNHITELVAKDKRPICTVLYQFMMVNTYEPADLTSCFRLLLEFDYVQMQVTKKHVNRLLLRTQQLLNLSSTKQVRQFVGAYNRFPVEEAVQKAFMQEAGNYLGRVRHSGLLSGF